MEEKTRQKNEIGVIITDFQKALVMVPHRLLKNSLQLLGITYKTTTG